MPHSAAMPASSAARTTVRLLALPESGASALCVLYDVFTAVGVIWPHMTGEETEVEPFDVKIVGLTKDPFVCASDLPITPQCSIAEVERADIVIVTDLVLSMNEDPRGKWPAASDWLRGMYERGALIGSICTGAVALADAGLLDGEPATSHWSVADLFRRYYPQVELSADRILVAAGRDDRLVMGGGPSSWEDLSLYLIARFRSEAEAVRTAKIFLFGDRSEGQLPYAAMTRPRRHDDRIIADSQAWIAQNYDGPNPVSRMVQRSGLPERTFKRRFRAATGYTPVDYVQALRIEEAKQLLEATSQPTEEIGRQIGYEDPAFFRRLFKRRTGVTPGRYRQRYQGVARTL